MKSAFELALERSGGKLEHLDDDRKKAIAEVDSKLKAKVAEAELAFQERMASSVGDPGRQDEIRGELAVEIASIRSKYEREKEKIRDGGQA